MRLIYRREPWWRQIDWEAWAIGLVALIILALIICGIWWGAKAEQEGFMASCKKAGHSEAECQFEYRKAKAGQDQTTVIVNGGSYR